MYFKLLPPLPHSGFWFICQYSPNYLLLLLLFFFFLKKAYQMTYSLTAFLRIFRATMDWLSQKIFLLAFHCALGKEGDSHVCWLFCPELRVSLLYFGQGLSIYRNCFPETASVVEVLVKHVFKYSLWKLFSGASVIGAILPSSVSQSVYRWICSEVRHLEIWMEGDYFPCT